MLRDFGAGKYVVDIFHVLNIPATVARKIHENASKDSSSGQCIIS